MIEDHLCGKYSWIITYSIFTLYRNNVCFLSISISVFFFESDLYVWPFAQDLMLGFFSIRNWLKSLIFQCEFITCKRSVILAFSNRRKTKGKKLKKKKIIKHWSSSCSLLQLDNWFALWSFYVIYSLYYVRKEKLLLGSLIVCIRCRI